MFKKYQLEGNNELNSRHFRYIKREQLKDKINELALNIKRVTNL
jgi:hypothetical protein